MRQMDRHTRRTQRGVCSCPNHLRLHPRATHRRKTFIDTTAHFVAKNGAWFETMVRESAAPTRVRVSFSRKRKAKTKRRRLARKTLVTTRGGCERRALNWRGTPATPPRAARTRARARSPTSPRAPKAAGRGRPRARSGDALKRRAFLKNRFLMIRLRVPPRRKRLRRRRVPGPSTRRATGPESPRRCPARSHRAPSRAAGISPTGNAGSPRGALRGAHRRRSLLARRRRRAGKRRRRERSGRAAAAAREAAAP